MKRALAKNEKRQGGALLVGTNAPRIKEGIHAQGKMRMAER